MEGLLGSTPIRRTAALFHDSNEYLIKMIVIQCTILMDTCTYSSHIGHPSENQEHSLSIVLEHSVSLSWGTFQLVFQKCHTKDSCSPIAARMQQRVLLSQPHPQTAIVYSNRKLYNIVPTSSVLASPKPMGFKQVFKLVKSITISD